MQPSNRIYYSTFHWRLNMFRAAYRSSSGVLTVYAASGLHTHVVTGRSQVWVGTQIGFYNRDEKCLQRGTDWVFKKSSLRFVSKGLIHSTPPKSVSVTPFLIPLYLIQIFPIDFFFTNFLQNFAYFCSPNLHARLHVFSRNLEAASKF